MKNEENKKHLSERPPVVSVMGHIDHGKSTLLDYIRKTNIVDKEAGGITQRIAAYEVEKNGRRITFIDTPGHEAFKKMRSCGAIVADIAVLVVSAEDGVKPQTIEAYKAIHSAKVPFIVAINKIDKAEANIEKTKQSLAENEIYVEGYGGTVPWVAVSSKTGENINELLETIILLADIAELKGNKTENAHGFVIESHRDPKKGTGATLIIKDGTWKKGMCIVAGESISPARIVDDFKGKASKTASLSSPIFVYGFDKLPEAGSPFNSFENKKIGEEYLERMLSEKPICKKVKDCFISENENDAVLPIILKTDTACSLEATMHEIAKIKTDRIKIKTILTGVGDISENDVKTASGDERVVVLGFGVSAEPSAKNYADRIKVQVQTFDIIYKLTEWIENTLAERKPKIESEEITGTVKILKTFSKTRDNYIMGGRVESGEISVGNQFKIIRREAEIGKGKIKGLQQNKKETDSISAINEFGGSIQSSIEIAPGDKIQTFKIVTK